MEIFFLFLNWVYFCKYWIYWIYQKVNKNGKIERFSALKWSNLSKFKLLNEENSKKFFFCDFHTFVRRYVEVRKWYGKKIANIKVSKMVDEQSSSRSLENGIFKSHRIFIYIILEVFCIFHFTKNQHRALKGMHYS